LKLGSFQNGGGTVEVAPAHLTKDGALLKELLEQGGPFNDFHLRRIDAKQRQRIDWATFQLAAALAAAPSHGFALVDTAPRPGARGTTVGVVDPKREDGVLVQYVQVT